ncbi:MAG TPA: hypothetical protein VGW10_00815, partial [Solirubrobacteraceae bacterium]|nr:hypothetical protein [Solirubrobacteraceae bacterium]
MTRRPLLAFFLLICAFALAACGGDSGDDVDVAKVLRETFGEDKDIKSGRLDVNLRLDANGLASLQGPVSVRLAGPFIVPEPNVLPQFDFEADLNAGGQSIRAGATASADKGFVSFQGQAYALSDELFKQFKAGYAEESKKSGEEDQGVSFKTLGIDPQRWLRDPEYAGKEDVGGAETLHIRAGIDVPRLLEDVNRVLGRAEQIQDERARQLTEAERKQIDDAIKDAKIELWTGEEDKIMRRLNVVLKFEVPEANRSAAQGLTSGTIRFDLGLGAINEKQTIRSPENAKPLDELLTAVQG